MSMKATALVEQLQAATKHLDQVCDKQHVIGIMMVKQAGIQIDIGVNLSNGHIARASRIVLWEELASANVEVLKSQIDAAMEEMREFIMAELRKQRAAKSGLFTPRT
jgi:hypothetical protein